MLQSVDPTTGREIRRYAPHRDAEVRARIARAAKGATTWAVRPVSERAEALRQVAKALRADREAHAGLIVAEVGKPVRQARAEIDKCAAALEHYATIAAPALADRDAGSAARVVLAPLGVILGIMPWNFPYWQAVRFAAPTLAAGNTVLIKHASNTTGCLLGLERAFHEAGLEDELQALLVPSAAVGGVIDDPRVRGVSLTGSDAAGVAVGQRAGAALKPVVLELGGNDPFIVFDDADVAAAARQGAWARCINAGQSCIAAKRFLVHAAVHETFLAEFTAAIARLRVDDPRSETTDIGPLARADVRTDAWSQAERSITAGAHVALKGGPRAGRGFFMDPVVLDAVPTGAPAWREEVFGPVAPVRSFGSDAEAVQAANDSMFGLGASVWTRDAARADAVARRLETGMVSVNEIVASQPDLPFGGVKRSGIGRELGEEGLRAFVNVKTIKGRVGA